jgi:phosphoglycolate phosphatase
MVPLQLVVFDLDGTLVDSRPDILRALNLVRRAYGLTPVTFDQVTRGIGEGARALVEYCFPELTDQQLHEAHKAYLDQYNADCCNSTSIYPGVAQFFAQTQGVLFAVLTNKPASMTRQLLDHFGLTHYMEQVIADGDLPVRKPHPSTLQAILDHTHVPPEATLMVGDHYTDLSVAAAARTRSAFLLSGIGHPGEWTPTYRFSDFVHFAEWFAGHKLPL